MLFNNRKSRPWDFMGVLDESPMHPSIQNGTHPPNGRTQDQILTRNKNLCKFKTRF